MKSGNIAFKVSAEMNKEVTFILNNIQIQIHL